MQRLRQLFSQSELISSLLLVGAVIAAYGVDYLYNIAVGRMLSKEAFGIVVALGSVGQIAVVATSVIRTITARYTVDILNEPNGQQRVAGFFRRLMRSSFIWGGFGVLGLLLASPSIASFLQIPSSAPVIALMFGVLGMFFRPVAGGILQGAQRFGALGAVQLTQAILRLGFASLLVWLGYGAFGAIVALPLAVFIAFGASLYLMRDVISMTPEPDEVDLGGLFRYSMHTALGVVGYALLINMDAILAKRFFSAELAGDYSGAVILGRVVQFLPLAIIMVLFPKAAQRRAEGRDPGQILIPAMGVVALLCGGLAAVYFLFPDFILRYTIGDKYNVSGQLLALMGAAMALMSFANVWLNYFLSTEDRTRYVWLIWIAVVLQVVGIVLFHDKLVWLPMIVLGNGLWLSLAGLFHFMKTRKVSS